MKRGFLPSLSIEGCCDAAIYNEREGFGDEGKEKVFSPVKSETRLGIGGKASMIRRKVRRVSELAGKLQ